MTKTINEGGFISHLTELRKRLINSFIFLFVFFVLCYFFAEYIYGFLVEPYSNAVKNDGIERRLIFTALQETFLTYLILSSFENKLLASKQIIIPNIKIDKIKTYLWLKLIKNKMHNSIIDVIVLFNKFCDIKYFQNFS